MRRLQDQSGWVPVLGILLVTLFALILGSLVWSSYEGLTGPDRTQAKQAAPAAETTGGKPKASYANEVERDKPLVYIDAAATGQSQALPKDILGSFAVELWARQDEETGDWGALFVAGDWYYGPVALLARADRDKHLLQFYFDGKVVARGGAELGQGFHHVVASYDSGAAHLYVDGRPIAVGRVKAPSARVATLHFGRSVGGGVPSYDWAGQISRAALYEGPLSAERIKAHFAAGR